MRSSSPPSDPLPCRRRQAQPGDCVQIDLRLTPENGFVPEPLFDTEGVVTVVLGWGDFLPGLHELLRGKAVGESVANVSIDAGWGQRRNELVLTVPPQKLARFVADPTTLAVGDTIQLQPGMPVTVAALDGDTVTVDANHPLAGTSYSCSFTVLRIDPLPASFAYRATTAAAAEGAPSSLPQQSSPPFPYELASFSLGCFWGAQIAFDRLPGVVGTRVGYTQGVATADGRGPTYEEVCQGLHRHRETVLVVYDPAIVSYQQLLRLALERLAATTSSLELHRLFEPHHLQYKHGCFYHTAEQRVVAEEELAASGNRFGMELLQATEFFEAEEEHQKYLYKGGQSQKKETREAIRCYG